jgi:hypothetical protein
MPTAHADVSGFTTGCTFCVRHNTSCTPTSQALYVDTEGARALIFMQGHSQQRDLAGFEAIENPCMWRPLRPHPSKWLAPFPSQNWVLHAPPEVPA